VRLLPPKIHGILGSDGPLIGRSAKTRSWEKAEDFKRELVEEYEAKQQGLQEASRPKPALVTVKEAVSRFLNSKRRLGKVQSAGSLGKVLFAQGNDGVQAAYLDVGKHPSNPRPRAR